MNSENQIRTQKKEQLSFSQPSLVCQVVDVGDHYPYIKDVMCLWLVYELSKIQ